MFGAAPFGVPLHRAGKAACAFELERLDQAVGRMRGGTQAGREPVHALAVQRIDPRHRPAGPALHRAAGCEPDLVAGGVFLLRRVAALAVVHQPRHAMHGLVQAAAERDVDFLETAADAQQRHALLDTGAHQRERECIARRVERQQGVVDLLVEMRGMDVGRRPGQQHAVDQTQQAGQISGLCEREHHGLRQGAVPDRAGVLVAEQQVGSGMRAQLTMVGRQPDQAGWGRHVHVLLACSHSAGETAPRQGAGTDPG